MKRAHPKELTPGVMRSRPRVRLIGEELSVADPTAMPRRATLCVRPTELDIVMALALFFHWLHGRLAGTARRLR